MCSPTRRNVAHHLATGRFLMEARLGEPAASVALERFGYHESESTSCKKLDERPLLVIEPTTSSINASKIPPGELMINSRPVSGPNALYAVGSRRAV
jgi:hypothetical protein